MLLHLQPDIIGKDRNCHHTEKGENDFAADLHAEGHAHVLNIVDVEPTGDTDGLMQAHGSLHPNLDNLVNQQNNSHQNDCQSAICEDLP